MYELPEALTVANQINESIKGKVISNVIAAHTPHKFAWFNGDPEKYHDLLSGKSINKATGYGGMVEISADGALILVGDGSVLKFHDINDNKPEKHQLLVEFEDTSAITVSVQMYGGIWCFSEGRFDNKYYQIAKEKPSPLSSHFTWDYFQSMIEAPKIQKLSVKAFLATEQRIPGLGNGVLQDILYNARIHPKKKINLFTDAEKEAVYNSVKTTLMEMTCMGGRDTERDLYGCYGGYKTKLSKNTIDKPCPVCGSIVKKENYMGGNIYYCSDCQAV
ncbi:MAG: endonuclease VIII [Bacillota bacterium]|nr:endonuclease VIII [Bacillota bacterium]